MKKLLSVVLMLSFLIPQEPCEGTCLSEEETKNLYNNIQELQFDLDKNKEIIENLGPKLKEHNLFFVGIDIIGNYLTEINVTSPTGLKQINALNNVKLEKDFWDKLEAKYKLV